MGKDLSFRDDEVLIRIICTSATIIARVFEALKQTGVFEELVVTGITPSRFEASYRGYAIARLNKNLFKEKEEVKK